MDAPQTTNDMKLRTLDQELAPLVRSIFENEPCGNDPRRDANYLDLRELVSAHRRPEAETVDWAKVESLATSLLLNLTKDLRVATYLGTAFMRQGGIEGLSRSLRLLSLLVGEYKGHLYPRAKNGLEVAKAGAIRWCLEDALQLLQREQAKIDASQARFALERCEELASLCDQLLGEASCSFADLRVKLKELTSQESISESPAANPVEQHEGVERVKQPVAATVRAEGASGSWEDAWADLRGHAHHLRAKDPRDALAYRMLRSALWTGLDQAPQVGPAGHCEVPLPSSVRRKALQEHLAEKRWAGLLEDSENLLTQYVLCLDLQRYSVLALQGLGQADKAMGSIRSALTELLSRIPELLELHGVAGEPLASPETRAWIRRQVLPTTSVSNSRSTPSTLSSEESAWLPNILGQDSARAQLVSIQETLSQCQDRLSFARRAMLVAQHLPEIEGLASLLSAMALRALRSPTNAPMCLELERDCWETLSQSMSPAHRIQPTALVENSSLLDLAQVDLVKALWFLSPGTMLE